MRKSLLLPSFMGIFLMLVLSLMFSTQSRGQCLNDNAYYTSLTPVTVGVPVSAGCVYGGEYVNVNVCAGATYTFSTCGATWDTYITLFNGANAGALSFDDDGCGVVGGASNLTWTATFSGTLRVSVDVYGCTTNTVCSPIQVTQLTACPSVCSNLSMSISDGGCQSNGVTNLPSMNFTFFMTGGGCAVETLYFIENNGPLMQMDLSTFALNNGESINITEFNPNSSYVFAFATSDGTISIDYFYNTGTCPTGSCEPITITVDPDCFGTEVSWTLNSTTGVNYGSAAAGTYPNVTPLGGSVYTYNGCLPDGCYTFTINDTYGDGMMGAQYASCDVDGDFYVTDSQGALLVDGNPNFGFGTNYNFCIQPEACVVSNVFADGFGCVSGYDYYQMYVYYTGTCTVDYAWLYSTTLGWEMLDLTANNYQAGDPIDVYFGQSNTTYDFYFELSDGSTSATYFLVTGNCSTATCSVTSVTASYVGCSNGNEVVNFVVNGTGSCTPDIMWVSTDGLTYDPIDLGPFGYVLGQTIPIEFFLDNTTIYFYFELSDGTTSLVYTYTTGTCDPIGCSGLIINYVASDCIDNAGISTPSGSIFANYTGSCFVQGVYSSVNGGIYEYLDLSAYGFGSGDEIGLLFNVPNASYAVYYILSDGSISPVTTFTTPACVSAETICDCDGNQHSIDVLSWLGDGSLDNGSFLFLGVPVNFDCPLWGYDCGDDATVFPYDPYGVCSGSIPPANGCVAEECNMTTLAVATDCFPGEVNAYIYNSNGDQVVHFGPNELINNYTEYSLNMCLPAGCYTLVVTDSYGDGLAGSDCTQTGYISVTGTDTGTLYVYQSGNYGFGFQADFCVGPISTCNNLGLELSPAPCNQLNGILYPTVDMVFDYTGTCTVASVFLSGNGGVFNPIDVSAQGWGPGDTGTIFYLNPNASYNIYYVLSDGSISGLYSYTTADCNNEITICDCAGTSHTIGVLTWLGDGYADNGFYQWAGQNVDFNCSTWGYDCGDVAGSPTFDPYNVCDGGLPPNNGCSNGIVLGCTDPTALNYNSLATVNDGSCIYNIQVGCTDLGACNFSELAVIDNGTCEYITCAGCTNPAATNYDNTATIDDGSCIFIAIDGCTNETALNYDPLATVDDGSCIFQCVLPLISYDPLCVQGSTETFMVEMTINSLGNGAPYTITNTYNNTQYQLNFTGTINVGPFPNDATVAISVTSSTLDGCTVGSNVLTENCANGVTTGCTDPLATNYNANADVDDGSCTYNFSICDCTQEQWSPAVLSQLGDGISNNGANANLPNFNCSTWGFDCGDIPGAPSSDPNGVCSGNIPPLNGCDIGVNDVNLSFAVYPNPANGQVNITRGGYFGQINVRVLDSAGRVVMTDSYNETTTAWSMNTSSLAAGTYTLELFTHNTIDHVQLVIEH